MRKFSNILLYIFIIFFIVFYYRTIFLYAENAPFIDDYTGIFDFIIKYLRSESIDRKIHYIFRQHNEHRIALPRLITLMYYYTFNVINLKHLILISSINLLMLFMVMSQVVYSFKRDLLAILPLVFLTFHFQHQGNLFWAECSLQNLSVACLGIASIWFTIQSSAFSKAISIILAIFVTFSGGSGLAIWIVIWIIYILSKQWKSLVISCIVGITCISLFFFNYVSNSMSQTFSITKTVNDLIGTLGLLGGWVDFQEEGSNLLAVLIGLISLVIIVVPLLKIVIKQQFWDPISLFIFGSLLYVGASALIINLGRDSYTENRYKIFSIITLLLTYVSISRSLSKNTRSTKPVTGALIVCSMIFFLLTVWRYLPEINKHRRTILAELQVVMAYPHTNRTQPFAYRLENLRQLSAWDPPIDILEKEFKPVSNINSEKTSENIITDVNEKLITISYKSETPDSYYYLYAGSKQYEFYFPLYKQRHTFFEYLQTGKMYSGDNSKEILTSWLLEREYSIGIYNPANGQYLISDASRIQVLESSPAWLTYRWFNDYLPL